MKSAGVSSRSVHRVQGHGLACESCRFPVTSDGYGFSPEILDNILAGRSLKPEDLAGEGGLFRRLKKALLERALGAELTHHLGYEKGDPAGRGSGKQPQRHEQQSAVDGRRRD